MSRIKDIKRKKNMQEKRKRRYLRIRNTEILILIILIIIAGFIAVNKYILPEDAPKEEATETEDKKPSIKDLFIDKDSFEPVKITISSMGDCTLGRDEYNNYSTSLNAYYETKGPDYFFQNVRSILEADDLSIINFEGTLTESKTRMDKTYAFKAPAEYTKILTGSSVEAANLANNHSKDYGEQSLTDTISALDDAGIVNFGYDRTQIVEIKGVKIGLTGIYELAEHLGKKQEVKDNIAKLKEDGAQIIIVNFHWGIEREYVPNGTQVELAHLAIDEGADLVIGHHPHVLQGIEKYKGKYIAYSLGNFCFGGNKNPNDKDTMIFQQTFTVTEDGVEINDDINIIPCSLSSVSNLNDYCPTPLEGDAAQRVLDKIEKNSAGLTVQAEPEEEE